MICFKYLSNGDKFKFQPIRKEIDEYIAGVLCTEKPIEGNPYEGLDLLAQIAKFKAELKKPKSGKKSYEQKLRELRQGSEILNKHIYQKINDTQYIRIEPKAIHDGVPVVFDMIVPFRLVEKID